jgi:hypothetical protein
VLEVWAVFPAVAQEAEERLLIREPQVLVALVVLAS